MLKTLAKRFATPLIEIDDLVQEGLLAMYQAAPKFDPSRGVLFGVFATPMVQAAMFNLMRKSEPGIAMSRRAKSMQSRLRKFERDFIDSNGRNATRTEAAEGLGLEVNDVMAIASSCVDGSEKADPIDNYADPRDQQSELDAQLDRDELALGAVPFLLAALEPDEAELLTELFGLDGEDPATLETAASSRGVDRTTAMRRRDAAIEKLRTVDKMKAVVQYLDGDFTFFSAA